MKNRVPLYDHPHGLKAVDAEAAYAALKGPLFHGLVRVITVFAGVLGGLTYTQAQVTSDRLVNSGKEPQNWLTYSGGYSGKRHSTLEQISTANAKTIVAKWVYQTGATGKFETTPLVVDGILYATGPDNRAFAGSPIFLIG